MSEEFDEILVEVQRTQRAFVEVRMPRGVRLSLSQEDSIRQLLEANNFWDNLYDRAAWSSGWRKNVYPIEVLGWRNGLDSLPQWRFENTGQTWPYGAVALDARPYLANKKEGEE